MTRKSANERSERSGGGGQEKHAWNAKNIIFQLDNVASTPKPNDPRITDTVLIVGSISNKIQMPFGMKTFTTPIKKQFVEKIFLNT